jgi:chemotaxis signal transduction protein
VDEDLSGPSVSEAAIHLPEGATPEQAMMSHLLVRAGQYLCALPLGEVRRVLRGVVVHPLPGASAELRGLAEFGGEPLAVLDLAKLVRAPQGANPLYPVTVIAWIGRGDSRELVGLATDGALDVVRLAAEASVGGDGGLIRGEAVVAGDVVRVLDLAAFGGVAS